MTIPGIDGVNNKNNIKPDLNKYFTDCFMNSVFGNGHTTNPLKAEKIKDADVIMKGLPEIKDPKLRQEIENMILNGCEPSKDFVDMLIERLEKKQAEFEIAWAKYQEAKGDRMAYKEMFEKLQKKYANSESGYDQGLVTKAQNKYKDAEINSDVLLSIASYLAHRVI